MGLFDDFYALGGPQVKPNSGRVGDLWTSLKRGVEEIPGMVTGLADIPFALTMNDRPITRGAEIAGEATGFQPGKWAKAAEQNYSPNYQQSQQDIQQTWDDPNASGWDVAAQYAKNPGYVLNQTIESLPSMIAGGVGSRALMGVGRAAQLGLPGMMERGLGKWAAPVAAGIGEGGVTAGQQMEGYAGPDQRRNALGALGAGLTTGVIGVGAGRVANRFGLETAETAMAGGKRDLLSAADAPFMQRTMTRRILGGGANEALLQEVPQSGTEQMWQNYGEGAPLMGGVGRAAVEGGLAGGLMGAAFNIRRSHTAPSKPTDLLRLGLDPSVRDPNDMISFSDGSTMLRSEYEAIYGDKSKTSTQGPGAPVDMQLQTALGIQMDLGNLSLEDAVKMGYVQPGNAGLQQAARAATGLAPQDTINGMLGIGQRYADPKTYPAQFNAAADARTGQQIGDMANGQVEYNDTDLEAVQRRAGILEQERQAAVKEAEAVAAAKQKHAENRARVEALLLVPDQTGKIFPKDAKGKNVISDQLLTLQANMEKLRDAKALTPEQYTDFMGKIQHDLQAGTKDAISAVKSEVNKLIVEQGKPAVAKEKASVAKTTETKQAKPQEQKAAPAAVAPNGTKNVPAQQPVASSVAGSNNAQGSVGSGGPVAAVADTNSANATGTGTGNGAPGTAAATTPAAPAPVVKKSRVVPKGTFTEIKKDTPVSDIAAAPKDALDLAMEAVREKRRKRAENDAALAKGEAIPHPDVHQNLNAGPLNSEDLQDMIVAATWHIRNGARAFGAYTKAMVSDFGEAVVPHLRKIHTMVHDELKTKRVDVALDKHSQDKAPMVSFSSNAQGQDTGFTARMAKGPHAVATYSNGSWVLDPEKSGLTGATPHVLGVSREEALHELPYAVARAQAEVKESKAKTPKAEDGAQKQAVHFKPDGVGVDASGNVDLSALTRAVGKSKTHLRAVRYALGIDDDGTRMPNAYASQAAGHMAHLRTAVEMKAAGENGKAPLGRASTAAVNRLISDLGITPEAKSRFLASSIQGEPLAGHETSVVDGGYDVSEDDSPELQYGKATRDGVSLVDEDTGDTTEYDSDVKQAGLGSVLSVNGSQAKAENVRNRKADTADTRIRNKHVLLVLKEGVGTTDTFNLLMAADELAQFITTDALAGHETEVVQNNAAFNSNLEKALFGEIEKRNMDGKISRDVQARVVKKLQDDERMQKAEAGQTNTKSEDNAGDLIGEVSNAKKGLLNEKQDTGTAETSGETESEPDDEGAAHSGDEGTNAEPQFSKDSSTGKPTHTVESLTKTLTGFVRADALGRSVRVVATATDLSHLRDIVGALNDKSAVAFTKDGKAYLIADRIAQGKERGVFLHEVGAHLGLERMLTKEHLDRLTNQLQKWADRNDDSIESRLSKKALERVDAAKTDSSDRAAEHLAYFVEEAIKAGIDPTSTKYNTEFGRWFRTLWAAFKNSIRKLGINPDKLTAQDVVDMAYGAARLEVAGKWHGTAADFRKFNHEFMGSGEGAQVYGWGTYLADRMGIGKDYHASDVARKDIAPGTKNHYFHHPAWQYTNDTTNRLASGKAVKGIANPELEVGWVRYDGADRSTKQAFDWAIKNGLTKKSLEAAKDHLSEDSLAELEEWYSDNASVEEIPKAPDGNLMRLDTSVQDHEWLHWDKPLSEQSKHVQDALGLHKDEGNEAEDGLPAYAGGNDAIRLSPSYIKTMGDGATGQDVYKAMSKVHGSDKAASEYLDSVGIKGVRFLDNPSRTANLGKVESVHYVGPDDRFVEKLGQKIKDLDGGFQAAVAELRDYYVSTLSTLAEKEATPHHPDVTDLKIDFIEQANERLRKDALANTKKQIHLLDNAKPEDWKITLRKQEPATHNFVVFNDKNVFRVASLKGADSSRIKFSKDTTATAERASAEYVNAAERIRATMPVKAKDAFATITDRFQKLAPWLLTNHQLLEQYGSKLKSLGSYIGLTQAMTKAANDASAEFHKVLVRWDAFKSANPAVNKLLENLMLRATMAEIHPDIAFNDPLNRHLDATKQAEYDKLHAQYSALVPEAKKLYQDVKAQLKTDWDNRRAAYATLVDKMMANRMVSAMGDQAQEAKIRKDIADAIETYDKTVRDMKGPYFPLARFGEFLAIGESAELQALKKKLENATGDERRALEKQLLVMRKDPKHYQVSSHETKGQQNAALRAMKAAGLQERADMTDQQIDGMRVGSQQTLSNIMDVVNTQFSDDKGTANAINSTITSVFLRSLPEMHALRREAARQGIEGASPDMMRAFAAAGQKGSFYNARMQYAGDLTSAMFKMKSEAKGDTKMIHIFREMEQRMYLDMKKQNTPVQDILSSASWLYHIGVSPSFMLINSTQPWLVSGPVLAGRHGFVASTKALTSATQSALKILKDARWKDGKWDGWAGISKDSLTDTQERTMLRELMARGIVDEGQQNDSALFASGTNDWRAKAARWTGWTTQQIELVNRTATALAAYRLEMQKSGNYDTAVEYAYQTTINTQFDYSASGKARVMREGGGVPLAKLIFQFRSYQQGLLYLLGDNIKKLTNPDEQKQAAATLGYLVLSSGMAAGALGLPFMSAVLWGLDKFIPDDDPEGDAETRLRNYLFHLTGDRATANVMAKGVPAMFGADLSQRIGLGDVASPFQFMRLDKATTGKAKLGEVATNVLGPAAGLGAQFWDAYTRFSEGDLAKGAEKMTPKAIADVVKAARYATEGFTDGKGSLTGTELNGWEIALKALGVTSPTESGYYEGTTAIKDVTAAIKQREGNIGRHYQEALRSGDMAPVRAQIDKFNASHPENKITGKKEQEWRRAAREAGKDRTAGTGVKLGTKTQAAYNHLADFAR